MKHLIILLLLSSVCYGQKSDRLKQLPILRLHITQKPVSQVSDTALATIIVQHKIRKYAPSSSFQGYVVRSGRRTRYYCLDWVQMPNYLKVVRIK